MRGFLKNFRCPLIEAFPGSLSGDQCSAVHFRRQAKKYLARHRLLGTNPAFLAVGEIFFHSRFEFFAKLRNRFAVKTDDRTNSENTADENIVALVVLHSRGIALCVSSCSRLDSCSLEQLSCLLDLVTLASLPGCGR
jgi:hypothetical protein